MKLWSVIGLLFIIAVLATMPIFPQVTQRGVELRLDQAQAVGRYRRVTRRAYRRVGYADRAGLAAAAAGYYGTGYYGGYYGAPGYAFTYSRQPVGRIRFYASFRAEPSTCAARRGSSCGRALREAAAATSVA